MGAESVEPEIVDNNVRLTDRGRKFRGIDTFTPDEMLTPEKSPRFLNWNAIERHGSWCGRKGTGRIIDDGTTCVDSGASSIDSAYKGLCIVPLELNDQNDDNAQHTCAMLLGFTDQYPGYSGGDVNLCVVEPEPAWGHELDLRGFPGPDITLSKSASLTLRVNADYQTVRFASKTGIPLQTIKGITVAWSAGGFPRDVDKRDDSTVVGSKSITLDQDRATWDGTSTNYDITVPATGVYYVTVWAHSLTGTSEPVYGRFEIT